jgi:hypothetical protein
VSDADPIYFEKRSALPWTGLIMDLLFVLAGILVALISIVFSLTISKVIVILTAAAVYWTVFWVRSLRSAWPTGIWVDQTGIRIGDVRALPFATSDSQTVFTCSWSAVRKIVVLDRSWRAPSKAGAVAGLVPRSARIPVALVWLMVPLARAVLIIDADRQAAGSPRAELVDNVFSSGAPPATWTAYTRRPKALRAALARVPGGPPVRDHVGPGRP